MPISLGLVGASYEYHLHYMVLAVGSFIVTFAATCFNPVVINYLVECFMKYPTELNSILGIYRLGLGLGIPFFINTWVAKVGVGWVFGIQAFLSVAAFAPIVILMCYGHSLRSMSFKKLHRDEEGAQIINKE
jgi:MFS family permease